MTFTQLIDHIFKTLSSRFHNKLFGYIWFIALCVFGAQIGYSAGRYITYSRMEIPTPSNKEIQEIIHNESPAISINENLFPFGKFDLNFIIGPSGTDGYYQKRFTNSDFAAAYIGTVLSAFAITAFFSASKKIISNKFGFDMTPDNNTDVQNQGSSAATLANEIKFLKRTASEINLKSNLLLTIGIIMAGVGVSVFVLSPLNLPTIKEEPRYPIIFIEFSRSLGMLIFIEAIAWFLLRQYRALADDYKAIQFEISKKINALVSIIYINQQNLPDERVLLLANLLTPTSTTTILKPGETTESLENMKLEKNSPILTLAEKIIDKSKFTETK